jgi:hypothetical protein
LNHAQKILVLTGVAAIRRTAAQREDLQHKLEALLPHLSELVTTKIDWHREGKHLLVKRGELARWAEELDLPEDWMFRPFWRRWWDGVKKIVKRLRYKLNVKS